MEEYSYNQELKEKLIKNEDDLQNLWKFMKYQKRHMESIESTVKSLQRTTSSSSS